ncbi:MAG: endonuclease domain-containing protein [Bacteroidota bacterium]|nr:endonuclease domain-containing protein [Bacteroidota bacterium]
MKRKIIPYNLKLKEVARVLRNNSTLGEILLWKQLRYKQMLGFDFHRQKPLDQFIVDFYCNELSLAIEIDGSSHTTEEAIEKDKARQERLEAFGVTFLRFTEMEVRNSMRTVLTIIEDWITTNTK